MAVREVYPLDEEQWAEVQKMLEEGPTEESTRVVNEALERVEKMKNGTFELDL